MSNLFVQMKKKREVTSWIDATHLAQNGIFDLWLMLRGEHPNKRFLNFCINRTRRDGQICFQMLRFQILINLIGLPHSAL